ILACCCELSHFFFSSRRRHTRSKRDWSSDVCSSDLLKVDPDLIFPNPGLSIMDGAIYASGWNNIRSDGIARMYFEALSKKYKFKIGRASCRERVQIAALAKVVKSEDHARTRDEVTL